MGLLRFMATSRYYLQTQRSCNFGNCFCFSFRAR